MFFVFVFSCFPFGLFFGLFVLLRVARLCLCFLCVLRFLRILRFLRFSHSCHSCHSWCDVETRTATVRHAIQMGEISGNQARVREVVNCEPEKTNQYLKMASQEVQLICWTQVMRMRMWSMHSNKIWNHLRMRAHVMKTPPGFSESCSL